MLVTVENNRKNINNAVALAGAMAAAAAVAGWFWSPALLALGFCPLIYQDTVSLLKLAPPRRAKYGRNAPCPCGSGKKYKHCCLLKAAGTEAAKGTAAPGLG